MKDGMGGGEDGTALVPLTTRKPARWLLWRDSQVCRWNQGDKDEKTSAQPCFGKQRTVPWTCQMTQDAGPAQRSVVAVWWPPRRCSVRLHCLCFAVEEP